MLAYSVKAGTTCTTWVTGFLRGEFGDARPVRRWQCKKGRTCCGKNFRDSPRSRNVTIASSHGCCSPSWGRSLVFFAGTVLIWAFESGQKGSDIHGFGDAAFFTAVQLLTVSSSAKNPLSSGGKVLDVFLEIWAIFVVTAVAGSFASFFTSGDSN